MNEKQPDISAAILLFGLSTWQNNKYSWTKVNGKRHGFRTLSKLKADYPYLASPAKIIHRAKAKGLLEVVKAKKKTLYHLPDKTMEMCRKKKGGIWFNIDDAEKFGVEAAILLANLQWQIDEVDVFEEKAGGYSYFPLSPSTLAEHLPMSRWTIARHLEQLLEREDCPIVKHPALTHYYRRPKQGELLPSSETAPCAEGHGDVAEGKPPVAEGHEIQKGDIKLDSNESEKWYLPTRPAPAAPPQDGSVSPSAPSSEGLEQLMSLATDSLNKRRASGQFERGNRVIIRPHPEQTPFDDYSTSTADDDLDFDVIPDYKRLAQRANEEADDMQLAFEFRNLPFTQQDLHKFRQIFWDNWHLESPHFIEVLDACLYVQNPDKFISEGVILGSQYGIWDYPNDFEKDHSFLIPKRVRAASYFLYRLPEILVQLNPDKQEDHFSDMDFSYLGTPRVNKLVRQCWNGERVTRMRTQVTENPTAIAA